MMSLNILINSDSWSSSGVLSALVTLPQVPKIFVTVCDIKTATKTFPSSPLITILKEDSQGPHSVFARTGQIDSLFYIPMTGQEEVKAREMIDTALAHGVKHFVLASVDRGGAPEGQITGVRYFDAMAKIEAYLKAQTAGTSMSWVILQRAHYMDNYTVNGDFVSETICSLWAGLPPGKKVQLVTVKDVGWFAAQALVEPEKWKGKEVGMAGDELSFEEADRLSVEIRGSRIPRTWGFVGAGIKWAISDLGQNFDWLGKVGHAVDIEKCRELHPEVQDFANWLRRSGNLG